MHCAASSAIFGEGVVDVLGIGPELQLAQAGEIHQQPSSGHEDEFAMRGGVAALAVALTDERCGLARLAKQRVHDGGLACTGGADESGGLGGRDVAGDGVEPHCSRALSAKTGTPGA